MRIILEDFQILDILLSFKHFSYRLAICRSRDAPLALRGSTDIPSGPDAFPLAFGLEHVLLHFVLPQAYLDVVLPVAFTLVIYAYNSVWNSSIRSRIWS